LNAASKGSTRHGDEARAMRMLLLVLLTLAAVAAPTAFPSKDGAFTMAVPVESQKMDNPNPSSMLNLLCPATKALVVVTRGPGTNKSAAQLVKEIPGKVPWKISSSKVGKVGNRPAAIFLATQVMKEYPTFKSVVGIVPASKGLYIFQVHYTDGAPTTYEKWLQGVKWK